MARILLVEDEPALARSIRIGLQDEDYLVDHARDGEEALWLAGAGHHDAVILDLRIPKLSGWEVCRRIRSGGSQVPVLMLTACDTEEDVVRGLDAGADDYVTKPFSWPELLARVRALLRRAQAQSADCLSIADLELDPRAKRVRRGGEEVVLTLHEYRVLELLARHAGSVLSRARITAAVWPDEIGPDSNVLEVLVSHLRRKLERPGAAKLIHTRRGVGYLLAPEEE